MEPLIIFGTQVTFSLLVWSLLARWFALPQLAKLSRSDALVILMVPHMFRHIGLSFMVPGLPVEVLPDFFALPAAFGDLLAAILAILAMMAVRGGRSFAIPLVWIFNILGTVDLLKALSNPDIVPLLGGTWYIPTMLVPLLLVTHVIIFIFLLTKPKS